MLDKYQKLSLVKIEGPILVNAGPGSGKTRILIYRILKLFSRDIFGRNILIITFTNKAKEEIFERLRNTNNNIKNKLNYTKFLENIYIGTIHSLCLKILTNEVFIVKRPLIINTEDKKYILKSLKAKLKINLPIKVIDNYISNQLHNIEETKDNNLKLLHKEYIKFLNVNNLLDYDIILKKTYDLLSGNKSIKEKYSKQFKYILIDEYQDIDPIQDKIIKLLTCKNNNIFAIGDSNQSIYGFRGSDINTFLSFTNTYPNSHVYKLINNYRSSKEIVEGSLSFIKHNKLRMNINYKSIIGLKNKINIVTCDDERLEANFVVSEIEKIIGGTSLYHMDVNVNFSSCEEKNNFNDFAILYRTNRFSSFITPYLIKHSIPFQIIGKNILFEKEEIKFLLYILRYITFKDSISANYLRKYGIDLNKFINGKYSTIYKIISFIKTYNTIKNSKQALENINGLHNIINNIKYSSLEELLNILSLQQKETFIDKKSNSVKLLTFHQAKSLEFPNVFIVGLEKNNIPFMKYKDIKFDIEEERRLLYVGMTRAKERLYLSYTKKRFKYGRNIKNKPSCFLNEINKDYLEHLIIQSKFKKKEQIKMF